MKIGIIKEGKKPMDRRVPLSPKQCMELKQLYPQLSLVVQPVISDVSLIKNI